MKKLVLLLFLSILFLTACSSGESENSEVEQNVASYKGWVEHVLNAGNPDAAIDYLTENFIDHSLPPGVPGTLDGFKEWFTQFNQAFPDAHWTIEYIAGYEDMVVHHKTMVGTHTGSYFGTPPTGNKVSTQETAIARYKDGKIFEFWGTFDEYSIARQLEIVNQP